MKKRLRQIRTNGRPLRHPTCRKIFADEEAIETVANLAPRCALFNCRKIFADEEAIETDLILNFFGNFVFGRKIYADEEAIET